MRFSRREGTDRVSLAVDLCVETGMKKNYQRTNGKDESEGVPKARFTREETERKKRQARGGRG